MSEIFECTINSCGQRFYQEQHLAYYIHIRENHEHTYIRNKEYIDAKITVLKYEDPEFDNLETDGLVL